MTEPEYTNLLEYILNCKDLTNEMKAFSIVQAVYYGNNSCHAQIENNYNNEIAIEKLVLLTSGNGIRVGYRAEYLLSKLERDKVIDVFKQIQKKTTNNLFKELFKEPIKRLQEGSLIDFLLSEIYNILKDNEYKRKLKEVLGWINKGTLVNK